MPRGGRGLIAAALGGALAALALPRLGLWPLGWIGLAPLVLFANAAERRRDAAVLGFAAGFAYHAVVLHWVYLTCRFARVPAPVAVFAWAALAAFLALNWAAAAALTRHLAEKAPRAARPFLWALCWTAVAAATGHWTPRLAVDLLGYTQWTNLALLQCGAWGGPHLLGFSVMLVNAALAEAWEAERRSEAALPMTAALALAGGLWAQGAWILAARPAERGETRRVAILQPAVDQYEKWDENRDASLVENYRSLVFAPGGAAAMFVWPETALPRWQGRLEPFPEAAEWAVRLGVPHLVGVVARPEGDLGASNAVQLVGAGGKVEGFYAKRELVPFGEFVPLRAYVPRYVVENWLAVLDQLGDMSGGAKDQEPLPTPWGRAAVTICYEAMFPRWSNRDAARGARLIVNVTNDGWYKDTWGPYQHFRANVYRAIENRVDVIRSGNTGISAAIDPWGVVTAELGLNERGRLDADVPLADAFPRRSFYARNGDWLGLGAIVLVLLLLAERAKRARGR
jgi:apolipoprotein N-acyltransferase